MITGFYEPNAGVVTFLDEDITDLDPHEICELGIARTFQQTKLFHDMTVFENVVAGGLIKSQDVGSANEKAEEILVDVGIDDIRDRQAEDLPVGKRKLVEVSRALATEPDILLLDELAPGLTPAEVKDAQKLIEKLNKSGITICLIEHVMELVMNISERIIVLNQGSKISEGKPDEVASDEEVIRAYTGGEIDT